MTEGPKPFQAGPRSDQVDSVRAIAALSILVFHSFGIGGAFVNNSMTGDLLFPAEAGVTIFLVISGFLLYRPFARAHINGTDPPAVFGYVSRRFLRIVPAFWVALTISALVLSWNYVFEPDGILTFYTLGQVYAAVPLNESAIAPAWTLGLELSFYVFLPLFAWALRRLHPSNEKALPFHVKALAVLFAASLAFNVVLLASGHYKGINPAGFPAFATLPAQLHNFVLGMALALIFIGRENAVPRSERLASIIAGRSLWIWGIAIAAYLAAVVLVRPGRVDGLFSNGEYALRIPLYWLIALCLVAPAAIGISGESKVGRFLAAKPLILAGLISYGIYLWHWPIIIFLREHAGLPTGEFTAYAQWLAIAAPITIAIATASWLLVEKPSIVAGRRLSSRRIRFAADGK